MVIQQSVFPNPAERVVNMSVKEVQGLFGKYYIVEAVRGTEIGQAHFKRVLSCWCRFRTNDADNFFWYNPEVKQKVAHLLNTWADPENPESSWPAHNAAANV